MPDEMKYEKELKETIDEGIKNLEESIRALFLPIDKGLLDYKTAYSNSTVWTNKELDSFNPAR